MNTVHYSPADAGGGALRHRDAFAAFVTDDASRQSALTAANEQGWTGAMIAEGGIASAIESLCDVPTPRVLLIDISESSDPFRDLNQLAEVCMEGTRVIALGKVNDVELFRRLIQSGVDDYLVKPVSAATLSRAFTAAGRDRGAGRGAKPLGRMIVVVGARGGIGTTTLAANLAWMVAHEQNRRSMLVDLDLQFGGLALALDIEPSRGLAEALHNAGRIDDLLVERAAVKVDEQLSVLCAEEGLERATHVDSAAIEALTGRLRAGFECVVVDLPRAMLAAHAHLVAAADLVIVVTDYTLLAARDCPRVLKRVREAGPKGKVMLIADRVGAPGHGEIARADLEKTLEATIDFEIPHDPKGAGSSAETGKPLAVVAPRGKAAAAIRAVAGATMGGGDRAGKAPLWKRLLTGKGKKEA
ncbi:MAG: AAA family ATPase [Rhodospirillales bacterium]